MTKPYRHPEKLLAVYRVIAAYREEYFETPSLREIIRRLPKGEGMPKDPSVLSYLLAQMQELGMIELILNPNGRMMSIKLLPLSEANGSIRAAMEKESA